VPGLEEASREELIALVVEQARVIEQLTARVAELERRLARNSQNSSQPPSADGPQVAPRRSRRKGSGRKPGKQPGSPGNTLALVDDPDEVIEHQPSCCRGCGADLTDGELLGVVRRQVHDIPPVRPLIVEHRLHRRRCGCGAVTVADAPAGVAGPVQYGPSLRALAVYLLVFQHVPVARTAQLIADLTGARPSPGWVSTALAEAAAALVDVEKLIKSLIVLAHVVHVDETSVSISGARWWLHVAGTTKLTAYHLHSSRGRTAVAEFAVLPGYRGVAVHDALSVYDAYPDATHALCGAHLARELTAAAEAHPDEIWPEQARAALLGLNTAAHQARDQGLTLIPPEVAGPLLDRWQHAILCGLATHRPQPGRKQSKTRNLLVRLRDRDEQVLRFARDLSVPFTNNQAERDLRPAKTQLKISGCHRSETGARAWTRVRGYISTVRKHGDDVLTALGDAITGNPWTPPLSAT
jgi:transposase